MFTFITPAGSSVGGMPVSAQADINVVAGQIQITLTNLLANPTSVIQCISDFSFSISSGSLTGSTQTAASAATVNVAGNGTASPGSPPNFTTVAQVGWVYSPGPPGLLNVLGAGGAGPANLIIGPAGPGGVYTNANGSIAGNNPHNPFLNQSASFTISGQGITADTRITSVVFSFGTTAGNDVPGGPPGSSTPEPATVITLATGLPFCLLAVRRRFRRQQSEMAA
jgi:hypothetical protein